MRFALNELQGRFASHGYKKVSFLPVKITKKAQNRTKTYLILEMATGNVITKFPGEFRSFIKKIGGNYNSIMSQRSFSPDKDINIWISGKVSDKLKYVLMATSTSMVS